MRRCREQGASGLVYAAMLPAILAFVGLLVDGGAVLVARRETQVAADAAVLAATQSIDWDALEATNVLQLDGVGAAVIGPAYGSLNASGSTTACSAAGLRVTCTTQRIVTLSFMSMFGWSSLNVVSTSTGQLLVGITEDGE